MKKKTSPRRGPKATNLALYNRVKSEAKRKFKAWPSAYASGWLVQEYKRRGGTYTEKKTTGGLTRWFEEKWINVCKLPKTVECGRPSATGGNLRSAEGNIKEWKKKYPYCRPSKRISRKSPKTARQLSRSEIKRRCAMKRKSPKKRIIGGRSIKKKKSKRRSPRKKNMKQTSPFGGALLK
jgi:hypothetical protein